MINDKIIEGLREYLKAHYVPQIRAIAKKIHSIKNNQKFVSEPENKLEYGSYSSEVYEADVADEVDSVSLCLEDISDDASEYIKKHRKLGGFPYTLDQLRKEKNMTAAELYKKANIDRRLYSRLMGPEGRHPSMNTVISFALALQLERAKFDELLQTAGYALSNSSSRDVCIMYCLEKNIYNIDDVNALLFAIGIEPLTRDTV